MSWSIGLPTGLCARGMASVSCSLDDPPDLLVGDTIGVEVTGVHDRLVVRGQCRSEVSVRESVRRLFSELCAQLVPHQSYGGLLVSAEGNFSQLPPRRALRREATVVLKALSRCSALGDRVFSVCSVSPYAGDTRYSSSLLSAWRSVPRVLFYGIAGKRTFFSGRFRLA